MRSNIRRTRLQSAGFSLIELMIGMTLGLLSVIIIMQVMSLFEAQRRSTTGSADAQTNGGIALFSIVRDAQLAGFGLLPVTDSALECTTVTYGGTGVTSISPVGITQVAATGTTPATDTVTFRYASSQMGGAISQITAMAGAVASVGSNLGCAVNDMVLVSSGSSCAISQATAVSTAAPYTVTLSNTTLAAAGANLACLGNWNEVTYAVNTATGNLDRTVIVNGVSTTTPSVVGVVNLQAQYGIAATSNSNQITQWVDASGGTWAAPTVANRNRIKAVRVAVVARNDRLEPSPVSAACSSTTVASPAPTGVCAWAATTTFDGNVWTAPTIDLSPGNANWSRYRYRVFETIIPLRNIVWAKDTL
jgi:type IV pilus assembly protein PilW